MKKSVEQLFKEVVEELSQPLLAIAETVRALNRESQPDCSGSPCTCGESDIGRDETPEEVEFFRAHSLPSVRLVESGPTHAVYHIKTGVGTSTEPWPHENTCGARDGGPCDCKDKAGC